MIGWIHRFSQYQYFGSTSAGNGGRRSSVKVIGEDTCKKHERATLQKKRKSKSFCNEPERNIQNQNHGNNSPNGRQFIARDFKEFIRTAGMTHARTSPSYPQSNGKTGALAQIAKVGVHPIQHNVD